MSGKKQDSGETRYTLSGIPVKPFYTPEDIKDLDYERDLGNPGQYPLTRCLYPLGYRRYTWQQQNIMGFDLAEDTNRRQKLIMEAGATSYGGKVGMNIAFDNPTVNGYDSDDPRSQYEVGKGGVAIDSLKDIERLFDGLPLDNMNVGFIIDTPGPIILAMYVALADAQGIARGKLSGVVRNNPLARWMFSKTVIFPLRQSLRAMVDCIKFCVQEVPNMNAFTIDGYDLREAGVNAVQEIAFPMAKAIEVTRACIEAGLSADDVLPRFAWFLSANNYFFEEIAKIRAGRRIWAKIMQERFGAQKKGALQMKIHMQTGGSTLTAQEPLNNVARVAIQSLAGVLSGVQSLSTDSYDEAISVPTEEAVRVAIKTQKIIEHETGVVDVVDPLAGSYYLESLTNEMERRMMEYIDKIEGMGGFITAMENGYLEQEISNAAFKYQKEFEEGKRIIVGVNKYVEGKYIEVPAFDYNPEVERVAKERLSQLRKERDNQAVKESLDKIRKAALDGGDLMPRYIEAVKVYATVGEIMETLKGVWGVYSSEPVLANI